MGQKVNPISLRTTVNKNWKSRWYAKGDDFGDWVGEDEKIRAEINKQLKDAAVADVTIERFANRARVTVHTARPGIVIGRGGSDIDKLRDEISKITDKEIYVEIKEVKNLDLNAQLVADNIALQLERRVSFRRAMKRAIQMAIELGALGIKVEAAGRLGGAELARRESYKEGMIPLHTLRANVQYGTAEAHTTAGRIGVKVWICLKQEEEVKSNATYA